MLTQLALLQATVMNWLKERFSDEGGASLVEYALLLALIAIVAIGALVFLGHATSNVLNNSSQTLNSVAP